MSDVDGSEMAHRVECALGPELSRLKLDWREACDRWGPGHPAALGCLLALVRYAHGAPTAHAFEDGGQWWVSLDGEVLIGEGFRTGCAVTGKTEGDALVAALEAAPKKEAA